MVASLQTCANRQLSCQSILRANYHMLDNSYTAFIACCCILLPTQAVKSRSGIGPGYGIRAYSISCFWFLRFYRQLRKESQEFIVMGSANHLAWHMLLGSRKFLCPPIGARRRFRNP
jgi:hypothetical protein